MKGVAFVAMVVFLLIEALRDCLEEVVALADRARDLLDRDAMGESRREIRMCAFEDCDLDPVADYEMCAAHDERKRSRERARLDEDGTSVPKTQLRGVVAKDSTEKYGHINENQVEGYVLKDTPTPSEARSCPACGASDDEGGWLAHNTGECPPLPACTCRWEKHPMSLMPHRDRTGCPLHGLLAKTSAGYPPFPAASEPGALPVPGNFSADSSCKACGRPVGVLDDGKSTTDARGWCTDCQVDKG